MVKNASDNNGFRDLMTEEELIDFLRIPCVSKAKNQKHVIENLKRMRGLPCLHISHQPLYPREAVMKWIKSEAEKENR